MGKKYLRCYTCKKIFYGFMTRCIHQICPECMKKRKENKENGKADDKTQA